MTTLLSEHFTLEELSFSQQALRLGLDNTPPDDCVLNLTRGCRTVLEPSRTLLGVPLLVDSGYRSKAVNAAVGGDPLSRHMEGLACDFRPKGVPLQMAFDRLRVSPIPFDKIIIECDAWIHVAWARFGMAPRGIAMVASGKPGAWVYKLAEKVTV